MIKRREGISLGLNNGKIIAIIVGIILYAATSILTDFASVGEGVALRPGVAVPIFFGFAFGPIVGFLVGFLGNLGFDLFYSGFATLSPEGMGIAAWASALVFNWQLGNGMLGLIPGLAALQHRRYGTTQEILRAIAVIVLAVAIGTAVIILGDPIVYAQFYEQATYWGNVQVAFNDYFLTTFGTNMLNGLVLTPILLYNYARLDLWDIDLGEFASSGLLGRLLLTVLISAVVPIYLLTTFLIQVSSSTGLLETEGAVVLATQLMLTILLTFIFIVSNAALMGQSISQPIIRLSGAADKLEDNELDMDEADDLTEVEGNDEVATLSRVFGRMAKEVIQREQKLRERVQELQIIIDEQKRNEQVSEITESDFFQELRTKASDMRRRSKASRGDATEDTQETDE